MFTAVVGFNSSASFKPFRSPESLPEFIAGKYRLKKILGFLEMSWWRGLYNIMLALETDSVTQKIACSPVLLLPMIQWLIFSANTTEHNKSSSDMKIPWMVTCSWSLTIAILYLHSHATPVQDRCPIVTSPTGTGIENDPSPALPGE